MRSLNNYNKKRNFLLSGEPVGKLKKARGGIFVIQHHFATREHFDFRLAHNGVLLSWAVPKGLSNNPQDKRLAVQVEDHPLSYANFEGVIPAGNYGAGTVEIFDKGKFTPTYDLDYGLKKGHIKVVLNGKIFKGEFSLIKIDQKNWLIKKSATELKNKTPKSSSKNPFNSCPVELCKLTTQIPTGKNWAFEIKYDGYRILTFKEGGNIKFVTRNNKTFNKMPDIASSLNKIKSNFVLDGELVAINPAGKTDFGLLQANLKSNLPNCYMVFDLLALNGRDLRPLPLIKRKEMLKNLLVNLPANIQFSEHVINKGKQCFDFAKKNQLEGIVAKNLTSAYTGTRNGNWLKIKCYNRQEFVICGFVTSNKNPLLSALVLGYYNNSNLTYVGKVGSGLNENLKQQLHKKLTRLKTQHSPFLTVPKINAIWVKPTMVAEIQFAELTKQNLLRQPSFIALRQDKPAKQVQLESEK